MSKLAVVFCATVFIASAFGAILKNSDEAVTNVRIHGAIAKIDEYLDEVRDQIPILDQQYEGVNTQIIEYFKKNVTDRYNEGIQIITINMKHLGINFETSKCKHYFDEYEKFTQDVIDSLDTCISRATSPVVQSLRKAVREALQEQARIASLTKVDDTVESGAARAIVNVKKAFEQYVGLLDGSTIREAVFSQTPYVEFLKEEDGVFNSFLNCALTKKKKKLVVVPV